MLPLTKHLPSKNHTYLSSNRSAVIIPLLYIPLKVYYEFKITQLIIIKRCTNPNAGEGVGKRKLSYPVGEKGAATIEKSMEFP